MCFRVETSFKPCSPLLRVLFRKIRTLRKRDKDCASFHKGCPDHLTSRNEASNVLGITAGRHTLSVGQKERIDFWNRAMS